MGRMPRLDLARRPAITRLDPRDGLGQRLVGRSAFLGRLLQPSQLAIQPLDGLAKFLYSFAQLADFDIFNDWMAGEILNSDRQVAERCEHERSL